MTASHRPRNAPFVMHPAVPHTWMNHVDAIAAQYMHDSYVVFQVCCIRVDIRGAEISKWGNATSDG